MRLGLPVRQDSERLLQRLAQMRVPAQRGSAVARLQLALHQRAMRRLVGGLELRQLLPLRTGTQQVDITGVHAFAGNFRPGFVATAWEQVAGVLPRGLRAFGGIAPGQCGFGPARERLRIDHQRAVRPERQLAALHNERIVAPQGLTGVVRRLAQVGGSGLGLELRPQRVDDLVARHAVSRLKAQQLHEVRRPQAGPALRRNSVRTDAHREASQQLNAQLQGRVGRRVE